MDQKDAEAEALRLGMTCGNKTRGDQEHALAFADQARRQMSFFNLFWTTPPSTTPTSKVDTRAPTPPSNPIDLETLPSFITTKKRPTVQLKPR